MSEQIAKKFYLAKDGTRTKSPGIDTVGLEWAFANGQNAVIELSEFNQDVLACAAWHGLSQKLGDKYAGMSASEAFEAWSEQREALAGTNGRWLKERESAGPRIGIIAEALFRVKSDKYATIALAQTEVASWDSETRARKLAVPLLAKEIVKVKEERANAKLEKLVDDGTTEL